MQEDYIYFGNCVGLANLNFNKRGIIFYSGFFANKDESHGLFSDFIPYLHKQGFSTLRFDMTGLGESDKNLEGVTLQTWIKDSCQALELFYDSGIKQIGITGFSLGAVYATINYLDSAAKIKTKIKGLSLWAPAFNPQKDMLSRYKQNGEYNQSKRGELFKSGKQVPVDLLDSLNLNLSDELEKIDCPLLICHSEYDSFIPLNTSRSLQRKIRNLDQLCVIRNSGHSFRNLNDSENKLPRNKVYNKTLSFFQKYL